MTSLKNYWELNFYNSFKGLFQDSTYAFKVSEVSCESYILLWGYAETLQVGYVKAKF